MTGLRPLHDLAAERLAKDAAELYDDMRTLERDARPGSRMP